MKFIPFITLVLLIASASAQKKGQALIDSLLDVLPTMKEDTNKVKALNTIAQTYMMIDHKQKFVYADQGLALAEKLDWKKGIANIHNLIGLLVGDTGNNKLAREHFEKSYAINVEIDSKINQLNNLNNIGRAYQREGEYSKATDYFFKGLKIAEEIKNNEKMAMIGTNLTAAFLTQKDYEKGARYGEMTLKYAELANAPDQIGKTLMLLGVLKMETKDTPASRQYLERSYKVYEEVGNKQQMAGVLSNLASLFYPDYKKQIEIYEKAQGMYDETGRFYIGSVDNLDNLGKTYHDLALQSKSPEREQYLKNSELYLQKALDIAQQTSAREYEADISLSLADLAEVKGNFKEALKYYKTGTTLNDSLFSQDKKNEIAGIEGKHNLDLKDKEIAIGKLELATQQRTQLALIIGLGLLCVIGGLLFWQNRMRKKSNMTLMVLNNQLDEANKVKAKFFGILSHDLRSPISNLITFLDLKNDAGLLTPAEQLAHQQQINQSAEELLQTMETMLLWSKEQMARFKPDVKLVPVQELFDHIQKFFPQVSNINLKFYNTEGLVVSGDENYLKVIMQNLTSNAIKVLRDTPGAEIKWEARKDGAKTILSITDNGPGINEEQVKSLYHEESSFNAKTGFGFHLIRDLAKAIQYNISIQSKPGLGTTFVLST